MVIRVSLCPYLCVCVCVCVSKDDVMVLYGLTESHKHKQKYSLVTPFMGELKEIIPVNMILNALI